MVIGSSSCRTDVITGGSTAGNKTANSQYWTIPDGAEWSFGSNSFTVYGWAYTTSNAAFRTVFGQRGASPNAAWQLGFDQATNRPSFRVTSTGNAVDLVGISNTAPVAATHNTWSMIVGTIDQISQNIRTSLNGADYYSRTFAAAGFSGTVADASGALRIGEVADGGGGNDLIGRIGQLAAWNGTFLPIEAVRWLWNKGWGRTAAEVQAILGDNLIFLNDMSGSPWTSAVGSNVSAVNSPGTAAGVRG